MIDYDPDGTLTADPGDVAGWDGRSVEPEPEPDDEALAARAAYAGLHAAFLLGTQISRHLVWDRDEDIDEGCLHGHLRASEPPLLFRFQRPMAGAEYLEVGVPCPVVAGCDWNSWDYLTDRAGLRAVLDGHPASAVCDEHGFAVPAGPMTPLDIDDYLGRRPPEATEHALQRVLHGVSQTQTTAGHTTGPPPDAPGDPTGTTPGTAP